MDAHRPLTLVLDEGTGSTRALLFGPAGEIAAIAQRPIAVHFPHHGWVEQDAAEIWRETEAVIREVSKRLSDPAAITAIGITNQRETVVAWDRATGEPLAPAISWQDRRTQPECTALRLAGEEAAVARATGLVLDPYFSASKMRWMLDHVPAVSEAARDGRLCLGTIDSWLLFKLTGRFATDATNASRTSLLALDGQRWEAGLCDLFGVPINALADVADTAGHFASTSILGPVIPVTAMIGDQQSSTIGQACLSSGATKATFGTGAFILTSTGSTVPASRHRLIGTVLSQIDGERLYALEGSLFAAGSIVQWLRDGLGLLDNAAESEELAASVDDSGGVTFIPALAGLGAPHWRTDVRARFTGLGFDTSRAHLVRAALDSVVHGCADLAAAFSADGAPWASVRADGGMIANDWLAQRLADLLDVPVERPNNVESTARGAAVCAAMGAGLQPDLETAARAMLPEYRLFEPRMAETERARLREDWRAELGFALA